MITWTSCMLREVYPLCVLGSIYIVVNFLSYYLLTCKSTSCTTQESICAGTWEHKLLTHENWHPPALWCRHNAGGCKHSVGGHLCHPPAQMAQCWRVPCVPRQHYAFAKQHSLSKAVKSCQMKKLWTTKFHNFLRCTTFIWVVHH
jgi:hypothetical protein